MRLGFRLFIPLTVLLFVPSLGLATNNLCPSPSCQIIIEIQCLDDCGGRPFGRLVSVTDLELDPPYPGHCDYEIGSRKNVMPDHRFVEAEVGDYMRFTGIQIYDKEGWIGRCEWKYEGKVSPWIRHVPLIRDFPFGFLAVGIILVAFFASALTRKEPKNRFRVSRAARRLEAALKAHDIDPDNPAAPESSESSES